MPRPRSFIPLIMIGLLDLILSKHVAYSLLGAFSAYSLAWIIRATRRGSRMTPLRGPPRKSLLFGLGRYIRASPDSSVLYEDWAREYGSAYRVSSALGSFRVILIDPKAVATFYARETVIYVRGSVSRRAAERLLGRNLISAEGEVHKRQRKALTPAFNNTAIRKLTPIFFDSAYKVKVAWDALLDSTPSGEALIDIQSWMKHVSLDSIGIGGFSHDFRTLNGERPDVLNAFESFSGVKPSFLEMAVFLMSLVLPIMDHIPTVTKTMAQKFSASMRVVAVKLLADSKKHGNQTLEDKSVLGLLIKGEDTVESHSPSEEIIGQMKLLIAAGYETTSIALSWALVELAKRNGVQTKLREEVSQFSAIDPSWEQLTTSLPYLDAVVHEILRLHPPVAETERIADKDDIIPLSTPVQTSDGTFVDSLAIAKGTSVVVPIMMINRSEAFWGPDAKEFRPERWLSEAGVDRAKEIQGHRNLLTFSDGSRLCLGRGFALAEFKAVLCTLINNFSFEFAEGTMIEISMGILPRPKVAGQEGVKLPLRVRRVE